VSKRRHTACGKLYSLASPLCILVYLHFAHCSLSQMKVAVYSHSIPPAVDGVSRRFTSIIHELHKAGHEVSLLQQS
jgi:hypothetical protein